MIAFLIWHLPNQGLAEYALYITLLQFEFYSLSKFRKGRATIYIIFLKQLTMKNVFINYSLGLILLLLGISTNDGFSQSGPITNLIKICSTEVGGGGTNDDPTNCPNDALEVQLDENCEGFVRINVFATNIATEPLSTSATYELPSQYPPLYLKHEYSPGNWLYTGPYTTFHYEGLREGADGTDSHLFYIEADLSTQTSNVSGCSNAPTGEVINFQMGIELLTLDRGYHPYPIGDFERPHEIFSCNVFDDTFCACRRDDPAHPECHDYVVPDPIYELKICLDCIECLAQHPDDPDNPATPGGLNSNGNQFNNQLGAQLSPNPFEDVINVSFVAAEDGEVAIQIYDAQGRLMQTQNQAVYQGRHLQTVNTSDLPDGIYYLHLQCGSLQINQKLIKLK